MSATDQVAYEKRVRPRMAAGAAAGGVMLLAGAALQASAPQPKVSEATVALIAYARGPAQIVAGAALTGLGLLALAGTLAFLLSLVKARRPAISNGTQVSAIIGGVLSCVGGIAYWVGYTTKAGEFHGAQTYLQAKSLLSGAVLPAAGYAGLLGTLLIAIAFVLVSLNAMRVGLLTRFVGYLGIVAAAASILLLGSPPALLIMIFWLMAVAYLFAGRWPNGDPPAWRTGEAEPWPSAAQLREERERAKGGANGRAKPARQQQPAPASQAATPAPGSTRSTTPKRKRKRRR